MEKGRKFLLCVLVHAWPSCLPWAPSPLGPPGRPRRFAIVSRGSSRKEQGRREEAASVSTVMERPRRTHSKRSGRGLLPRCRLIGTAAEARGRQPHH
jgi:hypothetical protein